MASLFCTCGRRFFASGVEPGRLAKCPGCGAWLRVPADPDSVFRPTIHRAKPRRSPRAISLRACLLYPLQDGPGVALLLFLPPFVWLMSVPALDLIRFAWSGPRGSFNPFFLVIVPLAAPLAVCFILTMGYILLFLGGMLVASALGEEMHPSWPMWDIHAILEGLGRWLWSGLVGLAIGGLPAVLYWFNCGEVGLADRIILAELTAVGSGYALMALAAALLHDTLLAANPVTVVRAVWRLRWAALRPSLATALALTVIVASFYGSLFLIPDSSLELAAVSLWASWVVSFYVAMVVLRLFGLTYYHHADALGWFQRKPQWAVWGRQGKLYANS